MTNIDQLLEAKAASTAESAGTADSADDVVFEATLSRLEEQREENTKKPLALLAMLSAANADLFREQAYFAQAIRKEMEASPPCLEDFQDWKELLDLRLRYAKQATQGAQLELRYAAAQADASSQTS